MVLKMKNKDAFLLAQITLSFGTIFLGILTLYSREFLWGTETLLGLLLLLMAYNNQLIYKRKYFTYIYLIAGVVFAVLAITKLING